LTRLVAVIAVVGVLLGAGCSDDDDGAVVTTTTEADDSTTTSTSTSAPEDTTTSEPSSEDDAAAASLAAEEFMAAAFPGHLASLSSYRPGDPQSGEIEVQRPAEGGGPGFLASTLLLRRSGSGFEVVGSAHDVNTIAEPTVGAEVPAGPLVVSGVGRGFEASIVVRALDGDGAEVASAVTMGGAFAEPEPYEVTLDLAAVPDGTPLMIVMAGGTGLDGDPGEFAAVQVTVAA